MRSAGQAMRHRQVLVTVLAFNHTSAVTASLDLRTLLFPWGLQERRMCWSSCPAASSSWSLPVSSGMSYKLPSTHYVEWLPPCLLAGSGFPPLTEPRGSGWRPYLLKLRVETPCGNLTWNPVWKAVAFPRPGCVSYVLKRREPPTSLELNRSNLGAYWWN